MTIILSSPVAPFDGAKGDRFLEKGVEQARTTDFANSLVEDSSRPSYQFDRLHLFVIHL